MDNTGLVDELKRVLQGEVTTAGRLLAILQTEQQALADSDAEVLEKILADKQPLIQQLDMATHEHKALLTRAGLVADARDIEGFLTTLDHSRLGVASTWKQLHDIVRQCRDQNQRNGRLAVFQRHKTEQALHILLGASPNNESYGPDGASTSSAASSRPLTSV
jgi:flagella synthesis protein FlgN